MDFEKLGKMLEFAQQFQHDDFWPGIVHHSRKQEHPRHQPQSPEQQFPLVDVLENEEGVLVLIDVPGVKKEDIQLYISGDYLTIKGPPYEFPQEGKSFLISERLHTSFERTIKLPDHTISTKVSSRMVNGVLEVQIPRSAKIHRNIKIE